MLNKISSTILSALFMLAIGFLGCSDKKVSDLYTQEENTDGETMNDVAVTKAIAILRSTASHNGSGTVRFTKTEEGIKILAEVEELAPGKHGFHIHEAGDCSAEDGTSAGGHYAPQNNPHGAPFDESRHVGDLGNITADEDGKAFFEWTDSRLSLEGEHSIIGRAVIVHAGGDDLSTQPTGDAGARVACGVIGIDKKK